MKVDLAINGHGFQVGPAAQSINLHSGGYGFSQTLGVVRIDRLSRTDGFDPTMLGTKDQNSAMP
jgi:hypothetical protein